MNICVLQCDDRPDLNYLQMTQKVNDIFCNKLNYKYQFIKINENLDELKFVVKQYYKLYVINQLLTKSEYDIIIFLDSDAWINNGFLLNSLINNLIKSNKNGCFSRDPYVKKNTFINSGSFIIKNNNFVKNMYNEIIKEFEQDLKKNNNDTQLLRISNGGWCDQYYVSKYIYENKDNFMIFIPDILNTPIGKIIRHNWLKNEKMYADLNYLLENKIIKDDLILNFEDILDKNCFPNEIIEGYEYFN